MKTCYVCGREFTPTCRKGAARYCSAECRSEADRRRKRDAYRHKKACGRTTKDTKKPVDKHKTISDVMRELSAYNKKHGTCISYGKWVQGGYTS